MIPWTEVSAYAMAAVWTGYGILHFAFVDETIRQVPPYLPFTRAIVLVSGVLELALAALLVPASTRLYGAWGSLVLIVLLTPAILHMMINDVIPDSWPQGIRRVVRWALVPHNLLFSLWAVSLARGVS